MAKKQNNRITQLPQTVDNQIRSRARNLKIGTCLISAEWEQTREANVVITREHVNGKFTLGMFLVDLGVLGVKESACRFNISRKEMDDLLDIIREKGQVVQVPYELAHNLIWGAVEYALQYNFKPHRSFAVSQFLLKEDTEDIPLVEIEFGVEGLPALFVSNENPRYNERRQLDTTAGKGNYTIINLGSNPYAGQ